MAPTRARTRSAGASEPLNDDIAEEANVVNRGDIETAAATLDASRCLVETGMLVVWQVFGVHIQLDTSKTSADIAVMLFHFSLPNVHCFHIELMAYMNPKIPSWFSDMMLTVGKICITLLLFIFHTKVIVSMATFFVQRKYVGPPRFDQNSLSHEFVIIFGEIIAEMRFFSSTVLLGSNSREVADMLILEGPIILACILDWCWSIRYFILLGSIWTVQKHHQLLGSSVVVNLEASSNKQLPALAEFIDAGLDNGLLLMSMRTMNMQQNMFSLLNQLCLMLQLHSP